MLGRIGAMLLALSLSQALGLLEVEDPIPDRIGLDDLFSLAGAGTVLGGLFGMGKSLAKQEQAIRVGGAAGFCVGVTIYTLALVAQVASQL
ncbi:MAG TPA: hypothetical protein VI039_05725 [Solirubrobacterales bacterium]